MVNVNDMHYINSHFTYLFTHILNYNYGNQK